MAHDVFISYARFAFRDRRAAEAIRVELKRRGIDCWVPPQDLRPDGGANAIARAIDTSLCVVHVYRPPQVPEEVTRAIEGGPPVVLFQLDAAEPSASLQWRPA